MRVTPDNPIVWQEGEQALKFDPTDTLYSKTYNPIPVGGQVSGGVIAFEIQGKTKAEIGQKGTKLRLSCKDVFGNKLSAEVTRRNVAEGLKVYPGVEPSPVLPKPHLEP